VNGDKDAFLIKRGHLFLSNLVGSEFIRGVEELREFKDGNCSLSFDVLTDSIVANLFEHCSFHRLIKPVKNLRGRQRSVEAEFEKRRNVLADDRYSEV